MGGSKSEEFLAKAAVGEDTYVRCTHCDYAANVEAVDTPGRPHPWRTTTRPPPTPRQTPDTPTIETLVDHLNLKFPRDDRPWEAGDTLKNVVFVVRAPRRHHRGAGDRRCPATARSTPSGWSPSSARAWCSSRSARPTSQPGPALAKGYIGPGALGEKKPAGIRYLARPPRRRGHPLGHRRRRRRQPRASTWSPAATSPPTASSTSPTSATATPAPTATAARSSRPAASRWATSSSSAASTPTRSACRCSTRTASSSPSPWAPTASVPRAPSPRSPRTPSTSSACAGRAPSRRPTSTSWPTGKDEAIFEAAEQLARRPVRARPRR